MTQNNLAFTEDQAIPEGYKKTEVGIIPDDWEISELGESVQFLDGMRRPIKGSDRNKIKGDFPYYGASGIVDYVNDYIFNDELILLGEDGENILSRNLPLAFKVSGKIWVNNHAHVMKPNQDWCIDFLTPYLESLDYSLLNSGTAQPKLNKQTCLKIKLLKPKLHEQKKIATALSDTDTLISELEKLIEKKQAIKTATMQQLLTGKTRLPEFALREDDTSKAYKESELGQIPEDWEVFNLPEVLWYQEGPGLRKWQFQSKGLKVINVTNLQESGYLDLDRTSRHISWDEFEKMYKHFACDEGDMVIASSGNSYCKTSRVRSVDLPLLMNTSVIRFKPLKNFSQAFMYVYLSSKFFKSQIDLLITGGAQPNFGPAHLEKIKIIAPKNYSEQNQIGEILLDLDHEIKALEIKLSKIKSIKQGMMQELLTGKTRLV